MPEGSQKSPPTVPEIVAGRLMRSLREDAPRLMKAYGTTRKLSKHLKMRRADAQDLVILQLIDEIRRLRAPLQRRRHNAGARRKP